MVPQEFKKSLCIAAGCITLIEALVWVVIGIFSIGEYGCSWDFFGVNKGTSAWTLLYISYFMGECRDPTSLEFYFIPPTDAAKMLQVWMWVFTITAAIWIPVSILLIVAAMGEVRGKFAAMLYSPWVIVSGTLVVLDLAGGITHLIDIFKTTTPDDFAEFSASVNWTKFTTEPSSGATTWLPSFFITLLFTRLLVIWLLNIYFLYIVYMASNAVRLYTTKYVESPLTTTGKKQTWKDKFYQGPDPALFERPSRKNSATTISRPILPSNQPVLPAANRQVEIKETQQRTLAESEPTKREDSMPKHDMSQIRYRLDEFGIPVEELDFSEPNENSETSKKNTFPRSSYPPTGRVYDHTGQPVKPDTVTDKWQDSPPPMARGVKVPPELNKFGPFSYINGDQPQLIHRQMSRSSSYPDKPPLIPRPDYTVAERQSAPIGFIPNRFRVPSPKRSYQSQSSFNYEGGQRSPTTRRMAPVPPKKPTVYPRSSNLPVSENPRLPPEGRYLPQQAVPSPQQAYFTRQTSQGNNYNINKLY